MNPTVAATTALNAQKTRLADLVASSAASGRRSVSSGISRVDAPLRPLLVSFVVSAGYTYDANTDELRW